MTESPFKPRDLEDRLDDVPVSMVSSFPRTRFVGRQSEIELLHELLTDPQTRLVSITGTGGLGKTRLAMALAALEDIAPRLTFVPLADVNDVDLLPVTILRALGLDALPGRPVLDLVTANLQDRNILLLLDNVEHLLAGISVLRHLLDECPDLQMLVTSRVRLGLSGEQVIPLGPLTLPLQGGSHTIMEESEAIQLFVDRARLALPTFHLSPENVADVAAICRQVDGLPLAIELAAAQSRLLAPRAIAARLRQHSLAHARGPLDAPLRQRTMHATVSWSVNLLPVEAAEFWRWLGVFEGGFTFDAGESMAAAIGLDTQTVPVMLEVLESYGLVRIALDARGEPRCFMLQAPRSVALDALRHDQTYAGACEAQTRFLREFCQIAEPGLMGPEGTAWFYRVEAEIANLRAAFRRDLDRGEAMIPLEMAGNLNWFWTDPGYIAEGRQWLEAMLSVVSEDVPPIVLAKALTAACSLAIWQSDIAASLQLASESLKLWEQIGDDQQVMNAMLHLANACFDNADFDEANRLLIDGQKRATHLHDGWYMAAFANVRGLLASTRGDYDEAVAWHESALAGWQSLGFEGHVQVALQSLGWALLHAGDPRRASECFSAVIDSVTDGQPTGESAITLLGVAILATQSGQRTLAIRMFAAGREFRRQLGLPLRTFVEDVVEATSRQLRESVGEQVFTRAWHEGRLLAWTESAGQAMTFLQSIEWDSVKLTEREREVLLLLVEGASDLEIADRLFISRRTASKHVAAILEKLEAPNRTTAVVIAMRRGLVSG